MEDKTYTFTHEELDKHVKDTFFGGYQAALDEMKRDDRDYSIAERMEHAYRRFVAQELEKIRGEEEKAKCQK